MRFRLPLLSPASPRLIAQHGVIAQHANNHRILRQRLKGREAWAPNEDVTTAALRDGDFTALGALTYIEHCTACHRLDGMARRRSIRRSRAIRWSLPIRPRSFR